MDVRFLEIPIVKPYLVNNNANNYFVDLFVNEEGTGGKTYMAFLKYYSYTV